MNEINLKYIQKHLSRICRVCLTLSRNLNHLSDEINVTYNNKPACMNIKSVLESVTTCTVLYDDEIPSHICSMCLSYLKIAYDFKEQFARSQNLLNQPYHNNSCLNNKKNTRKKSDSIHELDEDLVEVPVVNEKAPVELICGENHFPLNDILLVEKEEEEKDVFDGFLKNLGSEISAKFVNRSTEKKLKEVSEEEEMIVTIEAINPEGYEEEAVEEEEEEEEEEKVEGGESIEIIENDDLYYNIEKSIKKEMKTSIEQSVLFNNNDNMDNNVKNEFHGAIAQGEVEIQTIFECEICSKQFGSKQALKKHVHCVHSATSICEDCGLQFHSNSAFYHHLRKHKGKKFKCDQCDRSYLTRSHLRVHKVSHENERIYLCSVCGKDFNYSEALRYHMRLHTGEKPFGCTICGQKYRMNNTLKRHMRTHTKERPYACRFCIKRFSSLGEKKVHEMAIHTGERPYQCKYCGKACTKSGNLTTHLLSHPGDFECEVCQKTFIEERVLNVHLWRAHSISTKKSVD